jgi:uncharacterized membrane protein YeaQ/YmgE (transglycosylase-associated protein family)
MPNMSGTQLVWFLLIGLCAGWLAGKVARGGFGLVGDLVVGVVGAFIGAWLFAKAGITTYGFFGALASAFVGALLLVLLLRVIRRA